MTYQNKFLFNSKDYDTDSIKSKYPVLNKRRKRLTKYIRLALPKEDNAAERSRPSALSH